MEKQKWYHNTKFPAQVIQAAFENFKTQLDPKNAAVLPRTMQVTLGTETLSFETFDEFLAEYPKTHRYRFQYERNGISFYLISDARDPRIAGVWVTLPGRAAVEKVFQIFEQNLDVSKLVVESAPVKVFIGHGADPQWRDLKDHLQDQHGFQVTAYEVGPRAGLSVKDVLQNMLNTSSCALLVLTGEDLHSDGELHARDNVIHELG